jgi:hypothetical protein
LIQYGFVLFIHHRYLLSRFLLFFIGIIVLCIGYIVTLKWQQYFTTIVTIIEQWKSLPKTMDQYGWYIVKNGQKILSPYPHFFAIPNNEKISQKQ